MPRLARSLKSEGVTTRAMASGPVEGIETGAGGEPVGAGSAS